MHVATAKLHESLPADSLTQIERYHRGDIDYGSVRVYIKHLMELHLILDEARRVISEKEEKMREKAEKASQIEISDDSEHEK